MSWSISLSGDVERVQRELIDYSGKLTDESRVEYEEAKPHLLALIDLTVGDGMLIDVTASGSAAFTERDGQKVKAHGNCTVRITPRRAP